MGVEAHANHLNLGLGLENVISQYFEFTNVYAVVNVGVYSFRQHGSALV